MIYAGRGSSEALTKLAWEAAKERHSLVISPLQITSTRCLLSSTLQREQAPSSATRMGLSPVPPMQSVPVPSALSTFVDSAALQLSTNALLLEVLHNLRYQHGWTDLRIHPSPASPMDASALGNLNHADALRPLTQSAIAQPLHPPPIPLLDGVPPRPIYTHPDFQAHLLAHNLTDTDIPAQRE